LEAQGKGAHQQYAAADHRWFLVTEMGLNPIPAVPNENAGYTSFGAMQNVRRIQGAWVARQLLDRSKRDWETTKAEAVNALTLTGSVRKSYTGLFALDGGFYANSGENWVAGQTGSLKMVNNSNMLADKSFAAMNSVSKGPYSAAHIINSVNSWDLRENPNWEWDKIDTKDTCPGTGIDWGHNSTDTWEEKHTGNCLGDFSIHGQFESMVGGRVTTWRDRFVPDGHALKQLFIDQADTVEQGCVNETLAGGDWQHYLWGTPGNFYYKSSLVFGVHVHHIDENGDAEVRIYAGNVGFSHLKKPALFGPNCASCNSAFAAPCSIENARTLLAHGFAYIMIPKPIVDTFNDLNALDEYKFEATQSWWEPGGGPGGKPYVTFPKTTDLALDRTVNSQIQAQMLAATGRAGSFHIFVFDYNGVNMVDSSNPTEFNGKTMETYVNANFPTGLVNGNSLHNEFKAAAESGGFVWIRHKWYIPGKGAGNKFGDDPTTNANGYWRMTYILKTQKYNIPYYMGVGYADVLQPLDNKCSGSFADPCTDKNAQGVMGAAMSMILATPTIATLHDAMLQVTQGQVKQYPSDREQYIMDAATLGYKLQIYDKDWNCYAPAYDKASGINLMNSTMFEAKMRPCAAEYPASAKALIETTYSSFGGWAKDSKMRSIASGFIVDKLANPALTGTVETVQDTHYVKKVEHRVPGDTDATEFFVVMTLPEASLAPSCAVDADCWKEQTLDSAGLGNGTFAVHPNNNQLVCASGRCACTKTSAVNYAPVYTPVTCGDLPRNSIKCVPNDDAMCPASIPLGQCTECPTGTYRDQIPIPNDPSGVRLCTDGAICPGAVAIENCAPCQAGKFREKTPDANGVRKCIDANPGYIAVNSVEVACGVGTFQAESGKTTCVPCPRGTASNKEGRDRCDLCPVGQYTDEVKQTQCKMCVSASGPAFVTAAPGTASVEECVCPANTMKDNRDPDVAKHYCVDCPLGLDCPIGSTYTNFGIGCPEGTQKVGTASEEGGDPLKASDLGFKEAVEGRCFQVSKGFYMTEFSLPFKTKSCHSLGVNAFSTNGYQTPCMGGGNVGDLSCRFGHTGMNCGECLDNWYRNPDNICEECTTGVDVIPLLLVFIAFFGTVLGSYFFVNGKTTAKMSGHVVVAAGFGSFITTTQSIAAMSQLNLAWPDVLSGIWSTLKVFSFDLAIFKAGCVLGSNPVTDYTIKICGVYFTGLLLYSMSVVSRTIFPKESWKYMRPEAVFNTWGTVYQALFVTIVLVVMSPFRCYEHPDGTSSMSGAPSIICTEGDHTYMQVVAIIALCTQSLPFIAMYAYMVTVIPKRSLSDPRYAIKWKFIVYRFHAGAWYYGLAFLIRNFLVALSTTLDASQPFTQALFLGVVLLFFLLMQVLVWPWKSQLLNIIDMLQTSLVLLMILSAMALVDNTDTDGPGVVCATCWFLCVGLIATFLIHQTTMQAKLDCNAENKKIASEAEAARNKIRANKIRIIFESYSLIPEALRDETMMNFVTGVSEIDHGRLNKTLFMMAVEMFPDRGTILELFNDPERIEKVLASKGEARGRMLSSYRYDKEKEAMKSLASGASGPDGGALPASKMSSSKKSKDRKTRVGEVAHGLGMLAMGNADMGGAGVTRAKSNVPSEGSLRISLWGINAAEERMKEFDNTPVAVAPAAPATAEKYEKKVDGHDIVVTTDKGLEDNKSQATSC